MVGTFQAAGAIPFDLFDSFGGRVGILANQPADTALEAAVAFSRLPFPALSLIAADSES